ncbi:MAG: hypothetical protein KKA73_09515 [Chloroflexi bacterium]|nr:hypothetical protein [Chloroflexota bacterium]MBU1747915.1 hypothetical protein [Chloroflexota bacterium]
MTVEGPGHETHWPVWSSLLVLVIVALVLAVGLAAYVYELVQPNLGWLSGSSHGTLYI